ncbi:MAG: CRISPR-associated endonuclease Cas1 [Gemmatimonadota bacterium]
MKTDTAAAVANVPDLVPARMVNEFVYCPRLAFLEWVQGEWDDNLDTIQGRWVHRRVDDEPATEVGDDSGAADPDRPVTGRSVLLSSPSLGAVARMDLVEVEGRRATPVDYKKGTVPDMPWRAWDADRVQLCVQALILRDNGYETPQGVLYYAASRTRVDVVFDEALVAQTRSALDGVRTMAAAGRLPPPLVDSPKCPRCSLVGICLPDETNVLQGRLEAPPRRLVALRPDALPLYVQAQGGSVSKDGERLVVAVKGEAPVAVRLAEVSSVSLMGHVQVTTQAMRALCDEGIPLTLHTTTGWLIGVLNAGVGTRNVGVRLAQFAAASGAVALSLAREMVRGKILNQRTLLRRNLPTRDVAVTAALALGARQARAAATRESLLGIEGMAARRFFGALPGLLKGAGSWAAARFAEEGRTRRPPRDEVNAALSFCYALLTRECVLASLLVGFDPYLGLLHQPHFGRPSLALDLAEEFRPLVADSAVLTMFNQGELAIGNFVRRARGVMLTSKGRKTVISGFERRLQQSIVHPVFGYPVSYRRAIELQARLVRAVLLGETTTYRAFTTR